MLWDLLITFFIIGTVSFGGGYAIIPVIEREVVLDHGWMTSMEFADAIALAGMAPGSISVNTAIYVGYHVAGLPGAIMSAIGIVLPSVLMIVLILAFFYRWFKHRHVQAFFYALRPIVTSLIVYAAIRFLWKNDQLTWSFSWDTIFMVFIFAASLIALMKYRLNPVVVLLASGVVGIVLFY